VGFCGLTFARPFSPSGGEGLRQLPLSVCSPPAKPTCSRTGRRWAFRCCHSWWGQAQAPRIESKVPSSSLKVEFWPWVARRSVWAWW